MSIEKIISTFVEIKLKSTDDFLKVAETLTRMGIGSKHDKKLYQSCGILHRQGKYYIPHFLQMLELDGHKVNITEEDLARRNRICALLENWGLITVVNPKQIENQIEMHKLKVISFSDKNNWQLVSKYQIGSK